MNDDLNVKAAFDSVYDALDRLKQEKIGVEDANAVVSGLRRIDSVLQVIF